MPTSLGQSSPLSTKHVIAEAYTIQSNRGFSMKLMSLARFKGWGVSGERV
jgi:hypothetical protein